MILTREYLQHPGVWGSPLLESRDLICSVPPCRAQYEQLGESENPVLSSFTTRNYREYFQTAKGGIVELHMIHEGPGPLAELCWPRDRLPFPWMSSCAAVPRSRISWLKFSTRGIEVPSPPTPVPRCSNSMQTFITAFALVRGIAGPIPASV